MKNTAHFASLTLISMLLVACSSPQRSAPVVERSIDRRPVDTVTAPAVHPVVIKEGDRAGYYTVKKGDTLYRIALDFGQSYRDLVTWNNLSNPNDIKVDQVLRVAPPETGGGSSSSNVVVGVVTPPTSNVVVTPVVATTPPNSPATPNKSAPKAEKKAYSDQALADAQKPEAPVISSAPVTPVTPVTPATTSVLPASKAEPVVKSEPARTGSSKDEDDNPSFIWPVEGKVSSTFDEGRKGIDIAGKSGQPVLAAASGKVAYVGSGIRGYGNLVIVKHTTALWSAYAHNKQILVKEGQDVSKGQKIAEMGDTDADSVKLHFEIRQQGKPVDPMKYLPTSR